VFMSSPIAGAKVVRVVGVDAIRDGAEAALLRQRFHSIEELVLAVVAAVGSVGDIFRVFKLVGFDELMPDTCRAHEFGRLLTIVLRKARGKRGDR